MLPSFVRCQPKQSHARLELSRAHTLHRPAPSRAVAVSGSSVIIHRRPSYSCAHEQKAHGAEWVRSEDARFVVCEPCSAVQFFLSSWLQHAQMPRSRDMVILVPTTTRRHCSFVSKAAVCQFPSLYSEVNWFLFVREKSVCLCWRCCF